MTNRVAEALRQWTASDHNYEPYESREVLEERLSLFLAAGSDLAPRRC